MKRSLILLLIATFAPIALFAADTKNPDTKDQTVVEEIIARINNHIITRSDFTRAQEQIRNEAQQQNVPAQELNEREKDALRDSIDQELLVEKGEELGVSADSELVKRLDEIRKQMGLDSMEALEKAASAQGISYEDFKQNLRNNIITQNVIQREVGSKLVITPAEIQQFYNEHKSEMEQPEQVRLSEILISTASPETAPKDAPVVPEAERVAAAETKASQLLDEIKKGAKFEDVAKKNSNGPTAAQGGDLGLFKRGSLAKQLEDVTFAMKAGEVSNPIRTKQGFVILKVTQHDMAGVPPLKVVEQKIQDAIYFKKLQPALREYLTKLREDAYIDIKPGFVDTGASPNETKPVYTAAAAVQGAKKLKKKKKFLVF